MLDEVVEQLDESLFSDYVKAKANVVNAIIRKGILESGMDWYETPRPTGKSFNLQECCRSTKLFPTEVRDYVYQALLALVRVHAQVNSVTKPLLERAMNSLVEDLTSEAFTCFQKVEKFGMGGMLRVRPRILSSRAKRASDLSRELGYPRNRIYSPDTRPIRLSSCI